MFCLKIYLKLDINNFFYQSLLMLKMVRQDHGSRLLLSNNQSHTNYTMSYSQCHSILTYFSSTQLNIRSNQMDLFSIHKYNPHLLHQRYTLPYFVYYFACAYFLHLYLCFRFQEALFVIIARVHFIRARVHSCKIFDINNRIF